MSKHHSMAALMARSYANHPTVTAYDDPSGRLTFAELQRQVCRLGNALKQLGLERGDRVAIWMENRPEFLEIEQATFLFGFVRTALAARLHVDEVADIVTDCSAKVVFAGTSDAKTLSQKLAGPDAPIVLAVGDDYQALVESGPADPPANWPTEDDLAVLLYTSGTTGRPKGAALSNRNWLAMVTGVLAELPPIGSGDVVLHAGPMSHLSGSIGTACAARGATTTMLRRFNPGAVLKAVEHHHVTVLPLVPTMLAALTDEAERGTFDLSSLRAIPYGGSAVSPALLTRARMVFGDVLVQLYGLSEALVPITALTPVAHRNAERLASAGRPTPFVDVRILTDGGTPAVIGEPGEIQVRSDTVMVGYWEQPAATAEIITDDGWLRTGDIGYRDADGYLSIVDRKRDVIVSGGFTVYPAEVERVIQTLPQVDEVVVVGTPHDRWGETVTAVVTLRPGLHLTEADVITTCRARLADYKKPTSVLFVDTLPKNSTGKLLRREVRAPFWKHRTRPIGT
ncbi:class I adenylate-forming enzyme family protein [Kribbella sp. C-35]|uniref:class I adenylate-forming enzyme family protein n=1 Tax=Kribbella sp. C-35 TaxID=2789276 RepID=UPI00397A1E37